MNLHLIIDLTYLLLLLSSLVGGGYAFYLLLKGEEEDKKKYQNIDAALAQAKKEIMEEELKEFQKVIDEFKSFRTEIMIFLQEIKNNRHEPKQ